MDKATPTHSPAEKIWQCKIGGIADTQTPGWSDGPMRQAVEAAFEKVTGKAPTFLFSGWGASLTEPERAVVENRLPNRAEVERRAAQAAPIELNADVARQAKTALEKSLQWMATERAIRHYGPNFMGEVRDAIAALDAAQPSQEPVVQAVEYPPLPEWAKRDDLGGLVPSEIRAALRAYVDADRASRAPAVRMLTEAELHDAITTWNNIGGKTLVSRLIAQFCEVNAGKRIPADGKIGGAA